MLAHVHEEPPLVSMFRPDLAAFDAPVARALMKDPDARHQSCAELIEELDAARFGSRSGATRSEHRRPAR